MTKVYFMAILYLLSLKGKCCSADVRGYIRKKVSIFYTDNYFQNAIIFVQE